MAKVKRERAEAAAKVAREAAPQIDAHREAEAAAEALRERTRQAEAARVQAVVPAGPVGGLFGPR